jgi:hypothetical protein
MGTAAEQCACGAMVALNMDANGQPTGWWVKHPDDMTEDDLDLEAAVMEATTKVGRPSITCLCGRTYRALDRRPWIIRQER